MYFSEDLIEEVRQKNDIVDVISGYVKLQKKGSSYFGLCPFHNRKSPSFSVSRGKQMYYCFGCGAGGNVFTFIMEYENYSFVEAFKMLAERAGVDIPEVEYSKEAKERADLKATLLEINKLAAKYFYAQLKTEQGKLAHTYLTGRGLSEETITAFGLGYSNKYSNDLYRYLKTKGYKDELLVKAGLISVDERHGAHDKFWNRVMFPIMDVNNRVIGFGGRVMGDAKPKYLNSPETEVFDKSRNLYGLNRARTSRKPYFLICEGYMDVISLHQAGFTNAVASLGTALTTGHASLIKRYVNEVYLTYDSDEAGTRAALRAMPILKEAGITAKIIRMEPYKDPDEFIKNLGTEAFEERINKARNGFLFSLEILEKEYGIPRRYLGTIMSPWAAKRLHEFGGDITKFRVVKVWPSILQQIAIAKTEPGDENNQDISALVGKVDIRKLEHYAQNDPDAYGYSGALCRANQGIMEFVEMFKAPIKVLHPLLTATQEGNYNGTEGISALPFNGIILAHSNESEWVTFRNNKNNEAFLDRVYIVKVPYCLRISEEIKIYEKLLNHSELTHAPCALARSKHCHVFPFFRA